MSRNKNNEKRDKITIIENKIDNLTNLFNKFMNPTVNNEHKTKKEKIKSNISYEKHP